MIEDLDGGDPGPSRRTHVRVVSAVLIVAAFVGYAAASSPRFQGPFATPDPNPLAIAALKPKEAAVDATRFSPVTICPSMTQLAVAPVFAASRPLTIDNTSRTAVSMTTVYSPDGKTALSVLWQTCAPGEIRTSLDRFAR